MKCTRLLSILQSQVGLWLPPYPSARPQSILRSKILTRLKLSKDMQCSRYIHTRTTSCRNTFRTKNFFNATYAKKTQGCEQIAKHSWNLGLRALSTSTSYSTNKSSTMANVSAILKNQSALQVIKPARKKAPKILEPGKTTQINNVVAYAMAEGIKLEDVEVYLINQGLYIIGEMPQDVTNALLVRGKYNVDEKPKEIFVFRDGSVVFWCVPEIERGAFMKMLSKYSVAPYLTSLVIYEREELDFEFTTGKSGLVGDTIHLRQAIVKTRAERMKRAERLGHSAETKEESERQFREEENDRLLEMYTFSNALSQSVKLAIWEASLSKFVTSIVSVTEDLRHGNKIKMSRKQVLMKTGELFSLRHLINLSSDLLDTPDFYWDRGKLEPLYQALCNNLNIARRTRVMNEKLSHCCELTELLSTQLNDAHHTRLEVMIIVLIMVEVVFECIHYAERYWESHASSTDVTERTESGLGAVTQG